MRTGRRILLIVVIAVVVFAVLVAFTPLGWRVGLPFARRALRQRTGLELTVGSVGGSPLSRITLTDVSLDDPDAGPILTIDELAAHYDLMSLRRGAPVVHELTASGVDVVLESVGGGAPTGWSRFASGDTVVVDDAEAVDWTLGEGHLRDVRIRYTNEDIATRSDVVVSELDASGDQDELSVELAAVGTVMHPAVTDTAHVRLTAAARLIGDVIEFERLTVAAGGRGPGAEADDGVGVDGRDVRSGHAAGGPSLSAGDALALAAHGTIPLSTEGRLTLILDTVMDAGEVLPLVAAASEVPPARAVLNLTGTLEGSWTALEWTAAAAAPTLDVAGYSVRDLAVHADGSPTTITIDEARAVLLGGSASVAGTVQMGVDGPRLTASGHASSIAVGRIPGSPVSGVVDAAFRGQMAPGDLSSVSGEASVGARGLLIERDGAAPVELGDASARLRVRGGDLTGTVLVRGADAEVGGRLTKDGVESVTGVVSVEDLATSLAGLTSVDLRGRLRASVRADRPMEDLTFTAEARAESLGVGPVRIGTASVTAEGTPDDMAGRFSMFDGDLSGAWGLDAAGVSVDAALDSLAVAGDFAVSPTRSLELDASTTGRVAFSADRDGAFDLTAELAALSVASTGESLRLMAPVVIEANRDSVRVRGLDLSGTPGALRVNGTFAPAGDTHVSAELESLRLASVLAVANAGEAGPDVRGTVNGEGALSMRNGALTLDARMSADDLVVNGVRVGDIDIDAESDESDLIFAVTSVSDAGGRITGLGSLPYASDSTSVFVLDTSREFAATIICSSYVFEGGPGFLPRIRGRKQFTLDGSALVAGRADSLGSINGAGRFERAGAAWGFVSFALADTFGFQVTDGAVELDGLSMEIMRQRALGPELGGRVDVSGRIEHDGRLALTATTADLDVAHVSRAITPGATPPITGTLTADAAIGGTLASPSVTFSWNLAEPGLGGVRFDALRGSGTADRHVLELASAELTLGKNVRTASGIVPLVRAQGPALHSGMYAGVSEMDVTVRADGFRLSRARGLPKGVKRLAGVIDADIHLRGAPESPDIEGMVALSGGEVELERLEQSVRDIEIRVVGSGGTATIERASARVGAGTLSATGTMQTSMSGGGGFAVDAEFAGVELTVKDMVDAKTSGRLKWNGTAASSLLKGRVTVDEAEVTYKAGLADLLARRPRAVVVPRAVGPRSNVALDVAADIVEPVRVRSNLAEMDLAGGIRVGGTLAEPTLSGGVSSDEGSLSYLGQEFLIESFSIVYTDPRKRVPFVDVAGTADVESSAGDAYVVTIRYQGFAGEAVPQLTSVPPLSEPDIAALLTFGDTMGALTSGTGSGSSGESFGSLARSAFVGGLFGVAETTARRWLNLDTVDLSGESLDTGGLSDAQVTVGKRFGRRLSVDYTTELGGFTGQTVGLSWRLTDEISIETKANQEGNHAIGLKFRLRLE